MATHAVTARGKDPARQGSTDLYATPPMCIFFDELAAGSRQLAGMD